jgi:hypothetical protein
MAFANALRCAALGASLLVLGACGDDADIGESTATDSTTMSTTLSTTTLTTSDPDTSTTADPDTSSSGDATTGGPACPDTHACIAVPDGWTGPVLLRESSDPKAPGECPETYPALEPAGGADLTAESAECGCSCGDAAGTTCALATTLHHWGTDPTCSAGSPVESFNVFTTVCNPLGLNVPPDSYFQVEPVLVEGGACAPETAAVIPPALWATNGSTCGGAELLEGCDASEVCAPRADDEALCVYQVGDEDCPEGWDARQETYHQAVDDQRACNECTCGEPVGLCDNAVITMFANICNPPVSGSVVASGECYAGSVVQPTQSAIFNVGDPSAFCVASGAVATGSAEPIDPVTVCCAE